MLAEIHMHSIVTTDFTRFIGDRTIDPRDFGSLRQNISGAVSLIQLSYPHRRRRLL
jgi:hypothetical protein